MKKIRIINTGKKCRKLSQEDVAKALGAKPVDIKIDTSKGPISLYGARQLAYKILESQNGSTTN